MFNQTKLKNNLQLITIPMTGTNTATVLVMIGTGSRYETRLNNGISHFLEHMFFKGTKKWPTALALSSALDSLGAEYNAFTSKEYTGYWIKARADKIKPALAIISEMLLNPIIAGEELEREKGVIIEELNMYRDNPMMYIEDVMENLLYGDTPAGWDTIGTKENILRFQREDFTSYLNSQYGVNNTVICLAGNIPHPTLPLVRGGKSDLSPLARGRLRGGEALVNKYFGTKPLLSRGQNFQEKERVKEKQVKSAVKIHYKKTDQAHLSLGVRTGGYGHEDKIILNLLSIILGGSMSSRLFINLRERAGLAYYVRTDTELYTDSGYLTARAGVPVNKIEQAIKIILHEYKKIKTELLPAQELKRAKDLFKGRLPLQLEGSDDIANWYGRQAIIFNTIARTPSPVLSFAKREAILSPEEFMSALGKISARDIRRVAKNIFVNKGLNLAIIGPYKNGKMFEKLLYT